MSNYMPNIEDVYRNRTLYIKEMETYLENLKKQKENKVMSSTANLGKSLTESLREGLENFAKWATLVTDMLKNSDELKNNLEALNELDSALTDLKKVSEECVKEYKGSINS